MFVVVSRAKSALAYVWGLSVALVAHVEFGAQWHTDNWGTEGVGAFEAFGFGWE